MARIIASLTLALALSGALSGCGALATGPGLAFLTLTTFVTTKKTPTDHATTWLTGQECSSLAMTKGEDYCQPMGDDVSDQADTALYADSGQYVGSSPFCYRTLGSVTCYSRPDPLASEYARLD